MSAALVSISINFHPCNGLLSQVAATDGKQCSVINTYRALSISRSECEVGHVRRLCFLCVLLSGPLAILPEFGSVPIRLVDAKACSLSYLVMMETLKYSSFKNGWSQ